MITLNAADTLVATAGSDTTVTVTVFGDEVTVATGAQSYKVLYQGQPAAAGTTAITVGAGLQHLISDIHVTNTTGSPATIKLAVNGSAAAYVVLATTTLAAGYSYIYSSSGWTMHDTAGSIVGTSIAGLGDGDKGDITVSASGATWTIDNSAVTLAKMADLAQDQFIVRTTASTGVPETATVTAAARTVLDDATVSAMVDTLGGASATGTGGIVRATTPTLVTPEIGAATGTSLALTTALTLEETGAGTDKITLQAPASIAAPYTLTLPDTDGGANEVLKTDGSGVLSWTAAGAGDALVANPLSQFAATTSLQLKGVMSDETGSGALVFADTPTLVTPEIGVATGTSLQVTGSIKLKETGGGADVITMTAPASSAAWTMTLPDSAGTNAYVLQTNGSGTTSWVAQTGGSGSIVPPQGRLTLTTAVPVLSADVTDTQTIYYTPYVGDRIPIYDGSSVWTMGTFTEFSYAMNTTTHVIDSNFDVFIVSDSGTLRFVTPAKWTDSTTRATGLTMTNGIYLNTSTVNMFYGAGPTTLSVTALTGTYVGTFRTTGTAARTKMIMSPAAGTSGNEGALFVYNAYNRVDTQASSRDSTNSWTYTSATWQAFRNNSGNRVYVVNGLPGMVAHVLASSINANDGTARSRFTGIGYDSTTALATGVVTGYSNSSTGQTEQGVAAGNIGVAIGYHYLAPLESSDAAGTSTWWGDAGVSASVQTGITVLVGM